MRTGVALVGDNGAASWWREFRSTPWVASYFKRLAWATVLLSTVAYLFQLTAQIHSLHEVFIFTGEWIIFIIVIIDCIAIGLFAIWLNINKLSPVFRRIAAAFYPIIFIELILHFGPKGGWADLFYVSRWRYFFDGRMVAGAIIPLILLLFAAGIAYPLLVYLCQWIVNGFHQREQS